MSAPQFCAPQLAMMALVAITAAACSSEPHPTPEVTGVEPIITFVGLDADDPSELTASGVVEGVSESGGRCSFTFWAESGGASRLRTDGAADGDHTACGPVSIDSAQLPPGTYRVVLIYESDNAAGVSENVPLELR